MTANWNNGQDAELGIYQSLRDAGQLIPLTPEEVERVETFIDEASIVLPVELRNPSEVLSRIKAKEEQESAQRKPHVFGHLIRFLRKEKGFSVPQLADKARIDVQELQRIEEENEFEPKPRTVSQLAEVFGVIPKSLARVANLTRQVDDQIVKGAVKFAACAKDMDKLSREQRRALAEFVRLLNSLK